MLSLIVDVFLVRAAHDSTSHGGRPRGVALSMIAIISAAISGFYASIAHHLASACSLEDDADHDTWVARLASGS